MNAPEPEIIDPLNDSRPDPTGDALLARLVEYRRRFGPWHLDDRPEDVLWDDDGTTPPDAATLEEMARTVDAAHAHFGARYPRGTSSDWGLWAVIHRVPFYPECH